MVRCHFSFNGLVNYDSGHEMLEREEYHTIVSIFPVVFGFVSTAPGCTEDGALTEVKCLVSVLVVELNRTQCKYQENLNTCMMYLSKHVKKMKERIVCALEDYSKTALFSVNLLLKEPV